MQQVATQGVFTSTLLVDWKKKKKDAEFKHTKSCWILKENWKFSVLSN